MVDKNDTVISLKNVSKTFLIRDSKPQPAHIKLLNILSGKAMRKIEAVKNVSIDIQKGEFIGIIGANGSGKSTLLNLMAAVYQPDKEGEAYITGSFMKLSLGLGFNAQLSARENIYINASIMGLVFSDIDDKFNQIIKFAGLEKFVDTKVKFFSRGMKARLGFAIAIHSSPDILFLDEIFGGVGDESFREKSEKAFKEFLSDGKTIVLVSHNMTPLEENADRVLLMDHGKCEIIGNPIEVTEYYYKKILGRTKKNRTQNREYTKRKNVD